MGFVTAALALLAATFGKSAVKRGAATVAAGAGTALLLDGEGGLLPNPFNLLGSGGGTRRRRRRRALTASDRADIGFITGLLGPAAGKQFSITIATRAS